MPSLDHVNILADKAALPRFGTCTGQIYLIYRRVFAGNVTDSLQIGFIQALFDTQNRKSPKL